MECGQIFSYKKIGDKYEVYSADKKADVIEKSDCYEIITKTPEYFVNFFDLNVSTAVIMFSSGFISVAGLHGQKRWKLRHTAKNERNK